MLQNRLPALSLQKIYDDGYLACSTAVFYERQGNEPEALRCWKEAVEQIKRQCSEVDVPEYAVLSNADKILCDTIRDLEYQAQERIDLLEVLRSSRQNDPLLLAGSSSQTTDIKGNGSGMDVSVMAEGWIGGGTIPAITYGELSRPSPAVPPRPSMPLSRTSSYERGVSDTATGFKNSSGGSGTGRGGMSAPYDSNVVVEPTSFSHPAQDTLSKPLSRSPGREKQHHTLRSTLRTSISGESSPRQPRSSTSRSTAERLGASKAATLAWSTLGLQPRKTNSSQTLPALESSGKISSPSLPAPLPAKRGTSPQSPQAKLQWDSNSRRLVPHRVNTASAPVTLASRSSLNMSSAVTLDIRRSAEYTAPRPSSLSLNAAASALGRSLQSPVQSSHSNRSSSHQRPVAQPQFTNNEGGNPTARMNLAFGKLRPPGDIRSNHSETTYSSVPPDTRPDIKRSSHSNNSRTPPLSGGDRYAGAFLKAQSNTALKRGYGKEKGIVKSPHEAPSFSGDLQLEQLTDDEFDDGNGLDKSEEPLHDEVDESAGLTWKKRKQNILKHLPPGVDEEAAKQILNEIVVQGDVVRWNDIAGLEAAKKALREAVVYPFLRPDLFMGLREPATGMLLFGPPGTGKTMLARAVATESKSTFFSISASSLTSKYLGESEKLVRALFALAKVMSPSIIFVDEIDSILSQRSGSGENEATRRIKTEFLIQWSDLQRAAAGREDKDGDKDTRNSDASRVLVLAATNLPWVIDEAARRRFVRRQYIPLPEAETRAVQLRTLLGEQNHSLTEDDVKILVELTDGFSGSDITALAKDAAMGPLRSLGEALLLTKMDEIRPIELADFVSSLKTIRPSVSKVGLKEHEDWATQFGERGG